MITVKDTMFCIKDFLFIEVWAFIGSILGFFAFAHTDEHTLSYKIKRCCLSVGIGMFIAVPISMYLMESGDFSDKLCIILGGLGSFGLPDFIIKYWPKITESLADKVIDKTIDNNLDNICHKQYKQDNNNE